MRFAKFASQMEAVVASRILPTNIEPHGTYPALKSFRAVSHHPALYQSSPSDCEHLGDEKMRAHTVKLLRRDKIADDTMSFYFEKLRAFNSNRASI